ncbi:hypothetical protein L6452_28375 [Arctium lappa]|uniref:Uncharacterized protein n=1 Tax=Arctium lappa TaxID=4217 RepID=A0ACB8ZYI9_ARCLA|nr:hypothetical protein L6452_28375 [Arctium lappa]
MGQVVASNGVVEELTPTNGNTFTTSNLPTLFLKLVFFFLPTNKEPVNSIFLLYKTSLYLFFFNPNLSKNTQFSSFS